MFEDGRRCSLSPEGEGRGEGELDVQIECDTEWGLAFGRIFSALERLGFSGISFPLTPGPLPRGRGGQFGSATVSLSKGSNHRKGYLA